MLVYLIVFIAILPVSALAEEPEPQKSGPSTAELSIEEQNRQALLAFQEILDLTQQNDRREILPQIEEAYRGIIRKYPKAYLSQEAFWRLMMIYLTDYTPPEYLRAEKVLKEFTETYPESKLMSLMNDSLANAYYRNGQWEKLLRLYTPFVKKFVEDQKLQRPAEMFLYAEAKFNLGDLEEAEKGFNIVINFFPDSREAARAKERTLEINNKRKEKKEAEK